MSSNKIAVIGAGSWGTALAIHLASNGNCVRLWAHRESHCANLAEHRENRQYLPGVMFPPALSIEPDLSQCLSGVRDVLIVVPSTAFASTLEKISSHMRDDLRIVWGTKGLNQGDGRLLSSLVSDTISPSTPMAVLSGPSFASELSRGVPTAVSLAGNNDDFMSDLVHRFHSDSLRIYLNDDFVGVQLCGVMKNILAIAVGLIDGIGLGANARAALITRGIAEMSRLILAVGARFETLLSLAGLGDIVLTCTGGESRNRRFGLALGQGMSLSEISSEIGQEIEGLHNVYQLYHLAKAYNVSMPITEQIFLIVKHGKKVSESIHDLMLRTPASSEL